jgi:hypothetical protein
VAIRSLPWSSISQQTTQPRSNVRHGGGSRSTPKLHPESVIYAWSAIALHIPTSFLTCLTLFANVSISRVYYHLPHATLLGTIPTKVVNAKLLILHLQCLGLESTLDVRQRHNLHLAQITHLYISFSLRGALFLILLTVDVRFNNLTHFD